MMENVYGAKTESAYSDRLENSYGTRTENSYGDRPERVEKYQASGRRPPKNVRQAGYFTGDLRIYVEDYVHTFTRWLAEQDYSVRCAAVLVGEFAKSEHTRDVYAYGTVVIEGACADGKVEMTSEIWTRVYETIKSYFPEGEIVGWFYGGTSFTEEEKGMLKEVHLDHFAGTDRVLMLYDFLEGEEEFYRYEAGELARQSGYYIYYEKNTEMQNYMVDKKQGKNIGEEVEDRAVREVRARMHIQPRRKEGETEEAAESATNNVEGKSESGAKQGERARTSGETSKFLYMAGIVMAAIVVVAGASMIYNQERLKGFEQTLNQIIGTFQKEGDGADGNVGKDGDGNAEKGSDGNAEKGVNGEQIAENGNIFENQEAQETFQSGSGKKNSQEDKNKDTLGRDESNVNGSGESSGNGSGESSGNGSGGNSGNGSGESSGNENSGDGSGKNGNSESGGNGSSGNGSGESSSNGSNENSGNGGNGNGESSGNGNGESSGNGNGENSGNDGNENSGDGSSKNGNSESGGNGSSENGSKGQEAGNPGGLVDSSQYRIYIVQPGDTLVGICMKLYGSVKNLELIKGLNQISNENLIFAYQELLIP